MLRVGGWPDINIQGIANRKRIDPIAVTIKATKQLASGRKPPKFPAQGHTDIIRKSPQISPISSTTLWEQANLFTLQHSHRPSAWLYVDLCLCYHWCDSSGVKIQLKSHFTR